MDYPPFCLLLLTYDRKDYAVRTLRSALDSLSYSGPVSVHIADDGSGEAYQQELHAIAGGYANVDSVCVTDSQRGGYGRNYNLALQAIHTHSEIVLPLEDDWELVQPLDLDPLVEALSEGAFGCIRLGYIGYTQELRGSFLRQSGRMYIALDPDSPEPHVWAGHPRLETREWQRKVGPWPEGVHDPGTTEFMVAQTREAREGVVWPVDLVHPRGNLFAHIGTIQARNNQREEATV